MRGSRAGPGPPIKHQRVSVHCNQHEAECRSGTIPRLLVPRCRNAVSCCSWSNKISESPRKLVVETYRSIRSYVCLLATSKCLTSISVAGNVSTLLNDKRSAGWRKKSSKISSKVCGSASAGACLSGLALMSVLWESGTRGTYLGIMDFGTTRVCILSRPLRQSCTPSQVPYLHRYLKSCPWDGERRILDRALQEQRRLTSPNTLTLGETLSRPRNEQLPNMNEGRSEIRNCR